MSAKAEVQGNRDAVGAFAPSRLVADVVARFAGEAEAKGIALEWDVDASLPERCVGPVDLLAHVLEALVSTAVRDTRIGAVAVVARLEGAELAFEVADTGVGSSRPLAVRGGQSTSAIDAERRAACHDVLALGGDFTLESLSYRGTRCVVRLDAAPRGSGTMLAVRRAR